MAATYLLRKRQRELETISRPEAVAERIVCAEATKRANDERLRRFKILTQDNFEEASSFYRKRFQYWKNSLENDPSWSKT